MLLDHFNISVNASCSAKSHSPRSGDCKTERSLETRRAEHGRFPRLLSHVRLGQVETLPRDDVDLPILSLGRSGPECSTLSCRCSGLVAISPPHFIKQLSSCLLRSYLRRYMISGNHLHLAYYRGACNELGCKTTGSEHGVIRRRYEEESLSEKAF